MTRLPIMSPLPLLDTDLCLSQAAAAAQLGHDGRINLAELAGRLTLLRFIDNGLVSIDP